MGELLQPHLESYSYQHPEKSPQGVDRRYAPHFIAWQRVHKEIGDRYDATDYSQQDQKAAVFLEQCRDAITTTLAQRFHVPSDQIVRESIPDKEVGKLQRSHFAWMAIYDPSKRKLYYCDGRTEHGKLLMQHLLPHSGIDPRAAETVTLEYVTRSEKADQGEDPLKGKSFDPSRPYLIDGFFSSRPLNKEFPDVPEELHSISRVPLPETTTPKHENPPPS